LRWKGRALKVNRHNRQGQPQGPRAWTRAELEWIEDGIVPAWKRYDSEFVAAVKAKASWL
jgi:hypothetical protein